MDGDKYQEDFLPHLLQEYDLLFADVSFSQEYELHDLRQIGMVSEVEKSN